MPRPSNPALRASLPPVLLIHAFCAALWVLSIATFWRPLRQLISLSLGDDRYSHLIVIPIISACLLYWNRREIFRGAAYELRIGIPLVVAAVGFGWYLSLRLLSSGAGYRLSVVILMILLAWVAGFLLFYGVRHGQDRMGAASRNQQCGVCPVLHDGHASVPAGFLV